MYVGMYVGFENYKEDHKIQLVENKASGLNIRDNLYKVIGNLGISTKIKRLKIILKASCQGYHIKSNSNKNCLILCTWFIYWTIPYVERVY